jgi:hypothetical protein
MKEEKVVREAEKIEEKPTLLELIVILSGVITAVGALLGGLAALLTALI